VGAGPVPNVDTPEMGAARRRALEEELERIIPLLVAEGAQKIILFGSLAAGEVDTYSDIDLIVIMDTEERFLDRLGRLYLAAQPRLALDLLAYTPQEIEDMVQWNTWLREALERGRVLYEA